LSLSFLAYYRNMLEIFFYIVYKPAVYNEGISFLVMETNAQ